MGDKEEPCKLAARERIDRAAGADDVMEVWTMKSSKPPSIIPTGFTDESLENNPYLYSRRVLSNVATKCQNLFIEVPIIFLSNCF
jgi:hypothetical protein